MSGGRQIRHGSRHADHWSLRTLWLHLRGKLHRARVAPSGLSRSSTNSTVPGNIAYGQIPESITRGFRIATAGGASATRKVPIAGEGDVHFRTVYRALYRPRPTNDGRPIKSLIHNNLVLSPWAPLASELGRTCSLQCHDPITVQRALARFRPLVGSFSAN